MGRGKTNPKKVQKRQFRRSRRRRARAGSSGAGKLIARGVKSLVSTIPIVGPTIGKLADYTFKRFGITSSNLSNVTATGQTLTDASVQQTCLVARFNIDASVILAGSRSSVVVDMGKSILSQYAEGRVISLNIKLIPSGAMSKRAGDWHLGFQPFFNDAAEKIPGIVNTDWMPTEQGIHRVYLSRTGPASKPLSIEYRPTVYDGRAFLFNPLDSAYGQVSIRYDAYDRASYGDFTPDDFSCDTIISGVIETRTSGSMASTNDGGYKYSSFVKDKMVTGSAWICAPGIKIVEVLDTDCKSRGSVCSVSGRVNSIINFSPKQNTLTANFELLEITRQ